MKYRCNDGKAEYDIKMSEKSLLTLYQKWIATEVKDHTLNVELRQEEVG